MKMKKAVSAATRARIRREILEVLSREGGLFRREVNARLAVLHRLSAEEKRDNAPDSRRNLLYSAIGTLLSDLCREGALLRSAEGRYTLTSAAATATADATLRALVLSYCEGGARTRQEILAHTEPTLGTAEDFPARLGALIDRLVDEGELVADGDRLRRTVTEDEFFAEGDEEGLRSRYLELLHRQGGPYFERFVVTLLCEYYACTGREVLLAEVSGGADDGGIDGRIDTVDALGFAESVFIQTKCRRGDLHVTEREVRGFYGSVCAYGGSRGIFVTLSYFHTAARRFLDGIPNCVGIDGEKLFTIIKKCGYGLRRAGGGYCIDRRVFSESL